MAALIDDSHRDIFTQLLNSTQGKISLGDFRYLCGEFTKNKHFVYNFIIRKFNHGQSPKSISQVKIIFILKLFF